MTAQPPSVRKQPEAPVVAGSPAVATAGFTQQEKAAIVLGVLGSEAAGPILEQLSESQLRNFASAMSKLKKIGPEAVNAIIREFLDELARADLTINGGLGHARAILEDHVNEATLTRIIEDIDEPSVQNVWSKLAKVDDQVLAEFLVREHPQTAAVVLSKLSPEHAARIIGHMNAERAREVVNGLTKISSLNASVIQAIGAAISKDFLSAGRSGGQKFRPAERIGSIMNYTAGEIRQAVMSFLDERQPAFAEDVRRKMFTFADIPARLERRDIAAVVRSVDQETLLKALAGAAENAPETQEFILGGISSRVAEQVRADLTELGKIKLREAEQAQNQLMNAISDLQVTGEIKLIPPDSE